MLFDPLNPKHKVLHFAVSDYLLAPPAARSFINSRNTLESTKFSSILIFRFPSPSGTM